MKKQLDKIKMLRKLKRRNKFLSSYLCVRMREIIARDYKIDYMNIPFEYDLDWFDEWIIKEGRKLNPDYEFPGAWFGRISGISEFERALEFEDRIPIIEKEIKRLEELKNESRN